MLKENKIEFEVLPLMEREGGSSEQVKHRSSHHLYFFHPLDDSTELLSCGSIFEVHWLKLADYRCSHLEILGIEYVREGSLLAVQNGREFRVMPGDIFLMQPGAESELRTGPEGFCTKTSLSISGPLMFDFLHRSGLDQKDVIRSVDRSRLERILERFKALSQDLARNMRLYNGALCYEILRFLQHPEPEIAPPERFDNMVEFIREHLDETLDCKVLSKQAGCSITHLNRMFLRYFDCTPGRFVAQQRMRRAAEMLLEFAELSIKEISAQVGYADALNFSTAFKKEFGSSPLQYRKQHF